MAKQLANLTAIGESLRLLDSQFSFANPALISAPNSAIVDFSGNTRQLPDPSKTIRSAMGIERIMVEQIYQVNEKGALGENVFATLNDDANRIRLVGQWTNDTSTQFGPHVVTSTANDYVEITFNGTGLNILLVEDNTSRTLVSSIDGGADSANFYVSASAVLATRNYGTNVILNVATALTVGVHTVKVKFTAGTNFRFYGFEVLNEASTIRIPQGELHVGGNKNTNSAATTTAYNSGFDGSPTLNGKGGRVLVYLDTTGNVRKTIQQVDSSQLNMSSASHANEEAYRVYYPREFGAGRADDFSTLSTTASNRTFTSDDGTATLLGQNAKFNTGLGGVDALLTNNTTTDYIILTFVGTGVDIYSANTVNPDAIYTFSIDGSSVGTGITGTALAIGKVAKIVSGLPYGTHTLRIQATAIASVAQLMIGKFIVHQPKKPTLPDGAVEIADYNLMATFAANTVSGQDTIATGVIRKSNTRESLYVGTWSVSLNTANIGGYQLTTTTTSDYVEYVFFGNAFEYRFSTPGTALNVTMTVDGTNPTAAGGTTSFYGAGITSFTAGTGVIAIAASAAVGNGARVSGLTLGTHKVRITRTSGTGTMVLEAFDIGMPTYSAKSNIYADIQNTLPVGSNSISFSSKIGSSSPTATKAWTQAIGLTSATTNLTSYVPLPDMSCTIKTSGGRLRIQAHIQLTNGTANNDNFILFYVDGVSVGTFLSTTTPTSGYNTLDSLVVSVAVPAGFHKVDVYWKVNGGTATAGGSQRVLLVEEV